MGKSELHNDIAVWSTRVATDDVIECIEERCGTSVADQVVEAFERQLAASKPVCDICGYDESGLVWECYDSITRCYKCRNRLAKALNKYGMTS